MSEQAVREARPGPVDPWLRRQVKLAGSAPSFAESPLRVVWARAPESHPSAADAVARMREEHRRS